MSFVTTVGGDVCQQPGPPDGTHIPIGDPCRGRQVEALPGSMWLVGLDDNSNNPNDDDFWDVFFRLTFGPDQMGWVSMRYEYLGGETAHQVKVKVEEQWVELADSQDLNPVQAGDVIRLKIKDFDDHSVGFDGNPGVVWAAQVGAEVPEPSTWGMMAAAVAALAAQRVRGWLRA